MGHSNAELAALIGSRICHDLISPIGAITNGLELLDLTGAAQGPELDLIADSVGNAGARIRFFRIAYGAAGAQHLGPNEIVPVLDALSQGGRVSFDWLAEGPHPRAEVRLVFLALQCCETALPFGGRVCVDVQNGRWTIRANGEKVSIDNMLWGGLSNAGAPGDITPAQVQFSLLPLLAADLGRAVSFTPEDDAVTLEITARDPVPPGA